MLVILYFIYIIIDLIKKIGEGKMLFLCEKVKKKIDESEEENKGKWRRKMLFCYHRPFVLIQ